MFLVISQDHLPPLAPGVQVDSRGYRARQRARGQHRDLHTLRLRHQLEQSNRIVSTGIHKPNLKKAVLNGNAEVLSKPIFTFVTIYTDFCEWIF